jgi:hypothetical protein
MARVAAERALRSQLAGRRIIWMLGACAALVLHGPSCAVSGAPEAGGEKQVSESKTDSSRVIVELRIANIEGTPDDPARLAAIAAARQALLQELDGTTFRVVRTYDTIPFVALEVSPDAMAVLKRSTLVAGVQPDALGTTMKK